MKGNLVLLGVCIWAAAIFLLLYQPNIKGIWKNMLNWRKNLMEMHKGETKMRHDPDRQIAPWEKG